jgi:poly(A) polymerase
MMPSSSMTIEIKDSILSRIGAIADTDGVQAYVVGGYVRDRFLDKEVKDIDIVVIGDGIGFARRVAQEFGRNNVIVFEKFGTAMLPLDDRKIEFVAAREESYTRDSRKPVVQHASLEVDLSRRDFTINTLAAGLNKNRFGLLFDPYNGIHDIEQKILRTPLEPEKTFDDDPLRMMRAVRFASRLQFTIDPAALQAISFMAPRIKIVSMERIADEFLKILASPKPSV